MKRKLIFIFAAVLIVGSMSAQTNQYIFNFHDFSHKITVVAQINIDGVEQTSTDLEIGAFDGDDVTGSARIAEYGSNHYHRAYLAIFYNTAYDASFKLYNHATGEELTNCTVTFNGDPLTFVWEDENGYGTNKTPVIFNFVHPFTKDITAYTPNSNPPDHYYLIASPVGEVTPSVVNGFLTNNYNLYYYDQTQDKEWKNYEKASFNLIPGKGYLYANSQNVTLTFAAAPYSSEDFNVSLVYNAGVNQNTALIGWNLVGNPFAQPAYITDNRSFYRMNEYGTGLISESGAIAAMEGVFVKAADADDNNITFSTEQPSRSGEQLTVNLSQNRGAAIDRVIIGFSEGDVLPKFMLNENNAKLYIPQGNVDYAVVRSAGVGELPLNFKASKNGTYTLSIDTENVEINYLHLIDNITGMDVDLLQTPSYSFEATTRDYASRFRLVFAGTSTDATSSDAFAFYSNGNWIINNDGKATLQIVDVNGHLLCNEQINGCCSKSFEAAPGVYMLRLINGENVKTQKIVVR